MLEYLGKFSKMDKSLDGFIDLEEFCEYLNLPPTEEVKNIFRIYDIVSLMFIDPNPSLV